MKVYYKNLIKAYSSEYYDLIYCYNPCLKYYYARFYSFLRQTPLKQLYTNIAKKYKDIVKLILRQKKNARGIFRDNLFFRWSSHWNRNTTGRGIIFSKIVPWQRNLHLLLKLPPAKQLCLYTRTKEKR